MTFTEELEVKVREWCEMKAAGSLGGETLGGRERSERKCGKGMRLESVRRIV